MARKIELPEETDPQATEPPPEAEADGANGKQEKPPRSPRTQLPDRAEVNAMIADLQAELTGDGRERAQAVCNALTGTAAERLGLIITGRQPATPPQIVMASITVLKAAGLVDKHAAGITAEAGEYGG